jgi:hydroxymethylglutaryl-CoA reductase (NADPH)
MSIARERDLETPHTQSSSRADALLSLVGLQVEARLLECLRDSVSLIVPRSTRLAIGDVVQLTLTRHAQTIEELAVETVSDTARLRRAADREALGEFLGEGGLPALWVRCVATSPKARAQLWSLSTADDVAERPQPARERCSLPARGHDSEAARMQRVEYLREKTGKALTTLDQTRLVAERLSNNIENLIGGVEIPVGAAGPLLFNGQEASGNCYLPMATTEGALVMSATRGAFALTLAGGVRTRVLSQTMQRVPRFTFGDLDQACRFARWLQDFEPGIRAQVGEVSRHAKLVQVEPHIIGRTTHVRFVYETGDAAGQNMTTACTWHACQWILNHVKHVPGLALEEFTIEGGLSSDKKASFASLVRGRGIRVSAEAFIDRATLRRVLKVTPEQMLAGYHKSVNASMQAGMVGYNINVANVIAAVFTATGQDIACVHESSFGLFQVEPSGDGLYVSMLLPSLIVGTVGGGTGIPQQREYLELMDCAGTGRVGRLAEIIAGYCLALDLSTSSAITSGHFASAHERLGRNRPVSYLREEELDAPFFQRLLQEQQQSDAKVLAASKLDVRVGSSIVTELSATRNTAKSVGFAARRLEIEQNGEKSAHDVVVKMKPLAAEVLTVFRTIAASGGEHIANLARRHETVLGFSDCHRRELAVYRQTDPRFRRHAPAVYGIYDEPAREAHVLVLERLSGLALMDSADDPAGVKPVHMEAIVDGLAELHAIWLGREPELRAAKWLGKVATAVDMCAASELWTSLADLAHREFPEWVTERDHRRWMETIAGLESWWPELEGLPRTLIHNDCSPRNFGLRSLADGYQLCVYDWELATLHVPQRDMAEMLAFTMYGAFSRSDVEVWLERHRVALERSSGVPLPKLEYERAFVLALRDFLINRVALYVIGHTCRDYRFLPRVFRTLMRLLDQFDPITVARPSRPSSDSFLIPPPV